MSGKTSREKGKRGERELAKALSRLLGVDARRGQQFSGSPESPDVVGVPGIHVECKRTEKFSLYDSLEQSIDDAGEDIPVVMHRRNRKDWVIVARLEDLPELCARIHTVIGGED